jgi:hypothetical protein
MEKGVPLLRKWGCHWKADGSSGASSEQAMEATDFLPNFYGKGGATLKEMGVPLESRWFVRRIQ